MICRGNQSTGLYLMETTIMKELTCFIKKTLKLCEEFAYVLILFSRVLKTLIFKIGISFSS